MKETKAFFLLEEMNGISDSIITAAESYPAAARRKRFFVRFVSVAAVFALVIGIAVMRFAYLLNSDQIGGVGGTFVPEHTVQSALKGEGTRVISEAGNYYAPTSAGGELLWRTRDGKLYKKALSNCDLEVLSMYIGKGEAASADYDAHIDGMWLVDGLGTVRSPYLLDNPSNFSHGVLFDYSPEVIPTDEFVTALEKILD